MQNTDGKFDLVLSYPQWQGSGRSAHLRRGAQAAAEICRQYGPLAEVPDAGEGEAHGGINRWSAILEQFHSARAILDERQPRRLLTAGGDCACDVAVIDYMHRQYPDLTVIWVDAHLDANTTETSPSGNFHGMPVAALMGSAPADLQPLLSTPLSPAQFHYVSAHVGDDGDWAFQRDKNLSWLEPGQPVSGPVHIHFDLDALDPVEFPHIAYPEGKLSVEAGLALVRSVAATGMLVGLTITEFAPADDVGAEHGSRVIAQLCEAAIASTSGNVNSTSAVTPVSRRGKSESGTALRAYAIVLGLFLLLQGVWLAFSAIGLGFFWSNVLQALLPMVTGIAGIGAGALRGARAYCLMLGALFLFIGVFYFIPSTNSLVEDLLNANFAESCFRIVVGVVSLSVGLLASPAQEPTAG